MSASFEEFASSFDLHNLSHRALLKVLIPRWLEESEGDLDERISNAAYGETPKELQDVLRSLFSLNTTDRFLDLGAGAGGFVGRLLSLGVSACGIEQNPALVQTGQHQTLRAVACLGKPLPLSSRWQLVHTSRHQVCWNRGEPPLPEILFGWLREGYTCGEV